MARYVITTHRALRGKVTTALDAIKGDEAVRLISASDPDCVTVEGKDEVLDRLKAKIHDTHFVEPEVRRALQ